MYELPKWGDKRPCQADVLDLAKKDQMVAAGVNLWRQGDYKTWEEAMTALVCHLTVNRQLLLKTLVDLREAQPPPNIIIKNADQSEVSNDQKSNHTPTPAPWFDDGYRIHAPTDDSDKRNGRVIVEYKYIEDFNDGDAPLLETAPELLEELQECVEWLRARGCIPKEGTKAEKIIAKALGANAPGM